MYGARARSTSRVAGRIGRWPRDPPVRSQRNARQEKQHAEIHHRAAFPAAGMGGRGEGLFHGRGPRLRVPRAGRSRPTASTTQHGRQGRRLPEHREGPRRQRQLRLPLDGQRRRLARATASSTPTPIRFRPAGIFVPADSPIEDAGGPRRRADLGRLPVGQPLRDHPGARAVHAAPTRSSCRSPTACCSAAWSF